MNGAHALIRTLVDSGVDVCFANPGTSEMHFVAALDNVPEMRAVLGLFEGVVTGAADGYAPAWPDRPAATLLHLGPGLGNGIANLHNARRAHADRQHRRRPRDLPPPVRRAARLGHRLAREQRLGLAPHVARGRGGRRRWRGCRGRGTTSSGPGGDTGDPGGCLVARRCHTESAPAVDPAELRDRRNGRGRGQGVPVRGAGRPAAGWRGGTGARLAGRGPDHRRDRRQGARRDVPGPARARRRAPTARPARLPRRVRDRPARRHPPPRARRREGAGVVLRLSGQAELARPRRLRGALPRDRPDDSVDALERLADAVGAATPSRCSRPRGRPGPADRPDHRRDDRRRARRAAPRGRDRRRRSADRRAVGRRARPRARPATTGSPSPAARSAWACRSPPARRSPARTGR